MVSRYQMGKGAKGVRRAARAASFFVLMAGVSILATNAGAGPSGSNIVAGTGSVSEGANATVNQTSDRIYIEWNSFDLGLGESIEFIQPDAGAIAFNRVTGPGVSDIAGSITANGSVYISNPEGIIFQGTSSVDVHGFVATSAGVDVQNFMGQMVGGEIVYDLLAFSVPGNADATVINNGVIDVDQDGPEGAVRPFENQGIAILAAPHVVNNGTINARLSKVVLAGAETFAVDFAGDNLFSFAVTPGGAQADDVDVNHTGIINAPGGIVRLTTDSENAILDQVINMTGVVEAANAGARNGQIILSGPENADIAVTGTLNAEGGPGRPGGSITIDGENVTIADGTPGDATLSADGRTSGGTISVSANGGTLTVDANSSLTADKTGGGAGENTGAVSLSGEVVTVNGAVSAKTLSLVAQSDITVTGNLRGEGSADQSGGSITISGANVTIADASPADATLSADGGAGGGTISVSANGGTLTVDANSSLTADKTGGGAGENTGAVSLSGEVVTVNGAVSAEDLTLVTQAGTVAADLSFNIDNAAITIGGLHLDLADGRHSITINNAGLGTVDYEGGGKATLNAASFVTAGTDFSVRLRDPGRRFELDAGTIVNGGDLTFTAVENILIGNSNGGTAIGLAGSGNTLTLVSGGRIVADGGVIDLGTDGLLSFQADGFAGTTGAALPISGSGTIAGTAGGNIVLTQIDGGLLSVGSAGARTGLTSSNGLISLIADDLALDAALTAPGSVTLTTLTDGRDILLGGTGTGLSLSQSELLAIAAASLEIDARGGRLVEAPGSVLDLSASQFGALALIGSRFDLGGSIVLNGRELTITAPIRLTGDAALSTIGAGAAGADITFSAGAVTNGTGHDLAVSVGTAAFRPNGDLGAQGARLGAVTLTGSTIETTALMALGNITMTGDVTSGAIDTFGSISLSGGPVTTGTLNASGDIAVTGGAVSLGDTNSTGGGVSITGTSVSTGDITASGSVAVTGGPLSTGAIQSTNGSVTLTGTTLQTAAILAANAISLTGTGDVTAGDLRSTGGGISVSGDGVSNGAVTASGAVTLSGSSVQSGDIVSQGGNITIAGELALTDDLRVDRSGGGGGFISLETVNLGNFDLTIDAGTAGAVSSGAVSGDAGGVDLEAALSAAFSGDVDADHLSIGVVQNFVSVGGRLALRSLITSSSDAEIRLSGGAVVTESVDLQTRGTLQLAGTGQTYNFADGLRKDDGATDIAGTLLAGGTGVFLGAVNLIGDSTITVSGQTSDIALGAVTGAGQSLTLDAERSVTLASFEDATGSLTVAQAQTTQVTGNLTADSAAFNQSGGDVTVSGALDVDTLTTGTGTFNIALIGGGTIANSVVFQNRGMLTISNAGEVSLTAEGDFTAERPETHLAGRLTVTGALALGKVVLDGISEVNASGATAKFGAISGGQDLEVNGAATTVISMTGAVENSSGDLTFSGGQSVSFAGTVTASDLEFNDVQGAVTFNELVTATRLATNESGLSLSLLGNAVISGEGDFENSGGVQLGDSRNDTLSFDGSLSAANGVTRLAGTVTTQTGMVALGSVLLDNLGVIVSNGNKVSISGAIDGTGAGGQSFDVDAGAGSVTVSDAIGGNVALGAVDVSSGALDLKDITAQGAIELTGAATLNGIYRSGGSFTASGNVTITNADLAIDTTRTTPNGNAITIGGTLSGDGQSITLDAGTLRTVSIGAVDNIGGSVDFTGRNLSITGALGAEAVDFSRISRDVSIGGALTATTLITATDDGLGGTLTPRDIALLGGGKITDAVVFNNTGKVTLVSDSEFEFDGGFTAIGNGPGNATRLGGRFIVSGDVSLGGTVLQSSVEISSQTAANISIAGNIVGSVSGAQDLTISTTGGSIQLTGNTGESDLMLGTVDLNAGGNGQVSVHDIFAAGGIEFAAGTIGLNSRFETDADFVVDGDLTLGDDLTIISNMGNIRLGPVISSGGTPGVLRNEKPGDNPGTNVTLLAPQGNIDWNLELAPDTPDLSTVILRAGVGETAPGSGVFAQTNNTSNLTINGTILATNLVELRAGNDLEINAPIDVTRENRQGVAFLEAHNNITINQPFSADRMTILVKTFAQTVTDLERGLNGRIDIGRRLEIASIDPSSPASADLTGSIAGVLSIEASSGGVQLDSGNNPGFVFNGCQIGVLCPRTEVRPTPPEVRALELIDIPILPKPRAVDVRLSDMGNFEEMRRLGRRNIWSLDRNRQEAE